MIYVIEVTGAFESCPINTSEDLWEAVKLGKDYSRNFGFATRVRPLNRPANGETEVRPTKRLSTYRD